MKAIVCTKYGPPEVLQLQEVEKPFPKDNEVLIKTYATSASVSDSLVRSGRVNFLLWLPMRIFVGFKRPRRSILGLELAGKVEQIGKNVNRFKIGDDVFAFTGKRFGAYAEYTCLPEDGVNMPGDCLIALKPSNLTFEEAAACPTRGTLALHFLKDCNVQNGHKVLIYGASGGVGTFAVQIAKYFGAKVTGVCSASNLELVKSLGADEVIDYTKEDPTRSREHYDLIFDAVGKRKSSKFKSQCKKALSPKGKYISVDDGTPKIGIDSLLLLKELIETGKIKPVIGKSYPLDQIVEAHKYVDSGHKRGNLTIIIY